MERRGGGAPRIAQLVWFRCLAGATGTKGQMRSIKSNGGVHTFPPPAHVSSPTASLVRFNMFLEMSKHVS